MKKIKYNYEEFGSFATRQFSILTAISVHLKGVGSHKNVDTKGLCAIKPISISVHHLQFENYGQSFSFPAIPTTYSFLTLVLPRLSNPKMSTWSRV